MKDKESKPLNAAQNNYNQEQANINSTLSKLAILVSFLSLFVIMYQSYLSREENRLSRIQQSASVLPYLSSWITDIDGEFKWIIGNQGVGPAFIKGVDLVTLDAENSDTIHFNNSDHLIVHLSDKSPFLDSLGVITSTFTANTLLPSQTEKTIVRIKYGDHVLRQRIRQAILGSLIDGKITYEDVYGTRWYIDKETDGPVKITDGMN